MSQRAVLDTNSALVAPGGIVDSLREPELKLTVDDRILAEHTAFPSWRRTSRP